MSAPGVPTLLEIESLSVNFRTAGEGGVGYREICAVRDASLAVAEGETVALVGESGSGKTVTALSVLQLLSYLTASHPSGSIRFRGEELLGAPQERLRAIRGDRISMIFQEPMTSLNPLHTIERQVSETLLLHRGLNRTQARDRVVELLERVQLAHAAQRLDAWPHQLSGGERQRVMIAMALANEPDLLIADEPTTALDVTTQAQILLLLAELKQQSAMAVLLITHDLAVVRSIADRICVMKDGAVVETEMTEDLFTNPRHAYTRELIESEPPELATTSSGDAEPALEARDLKVHFPIQRGLLRRTTGYVRAVDGISFDLRRGRTIGVVGESGSGKSTLALALLRLIPSEGGIQLGRRDLRMVGGRELRATRREMQIVFQDPFASLSPRMTAAQIIEEGLRVHEPESDHGGRRQLVAAVMSEVGLEKDMMDRYPHEFSGGQRQRIAIARALVLKPALLILDEPTSALDRTVQRQVLELLVRLQREYDLAYLFISHDLRVVRAMADQLIVLRNGVVVEAGSAAEIFAHPRSDYTRALISASFT
jgi:microcin C transport system ATP-binding protein